MKWWDYKLHTQIKVSFVNIVFTDQEKPIHINLLDKSQIDWAKKQGYKYAHLGVLKLGIGPLVRPFILLSSLYVVVDTKNIEFCDVIIDGFLGPLHQGPCFSTIFPK